MPKPNDYSSKDEFMAACVPIVMKENGGDQNAAVGKCSGMWENKELEVFTPPASKKSLPDHAKEILRKAYSSCRTAWVKDHPKDRGNKDNKESCARIAWNAVKSAGYEMSFEDFQQIDLESIFQEQPIQPQKTKIDILAEIKKLFNKNNMAIDDDTLFSIVPKIKIQGISMKALIEELETEPLELQTVSPSEELQTVLALPRGRKYVVTKTFKGWVNFDDKLFKNIIENYNNKELSEPYIDKDHERAKSYGDFKNPRIVTEGLFVDFQLNKFGIELVKERAYKYISPTITDHIDTKGNKITNWLATISLVNSPALLGAMPALQEQLNLKLNEIRGKKKMSYNLQTDFKKLTDLSIKLNHPLSLQGEIDPEAIAQIFPDIVAMVEELSKKLQEVTGAKDKAEGDAAAAQEQAQAAQQEMQTMKAEKLNAEWDQLAKKALKMELWSPDEKKIEKKKERFFKEPQITRDEITDYMELKGIKDEDLKIIQFTKTDQESNTFKLSTEDAENIKELGIDINDPLVKQVYGKEE